MDSTMTLGQVDVPVSSTSVDWSVRDEDEDELYHAFMSSPREVDDIELSLIRDMWMLVLELEGMRTRILPAERQRSMRDSGTV
jgi:hypothetical protein